MQSKPSNDDIQRLLATVALCFDKADEHFSRRFDRPQSNFKQRGRAAGTAYLQRNELRFNYFMFLQDKEHFLQTVVPHEVSHIIVYQLFGANVRPHGVEWRGVMQAVFACKAERTHTFAVPTPKRAFTYRCECREHLLSVRRHAKTTKGVEYLCRQCKAKLTFLHEFL